MSKIPISIFIITHNEADRLPKTLEAVKELSDDLIVVDSGSEDETVELAKKLGAKVFHNDWTGYGSQKRFAEKLCKYEWLLNLDADEFMPEELVHEIIELFKNGAPNADAYEICIAEIFPNEKAPHPFSYALAPVRLYKKTHGEYSPSTVHDRVDLVQNAKVKRLKGVIHHFSVRSIGDQVRKLNLYSDSQVDDLFSSGKSISTIRVFIEFPIAFLKAYFLRRHFLRGTYGFITAMNFAFYRWLRIAKAYERKITKRK